MDVPELFFLPVLGLIAHTFLGLVNEEHVFCILREHQLHEIVANQAFFPAEILSGGHTVSYCVTGILKDCVTENYII